jgi:predicted ribosomally synthesized peptide with nif11-like leader
MSQEAVKNFYKLLQSDQELQKQVKIANSSSDIVQIATEKGYVFTEQEFETAMQEAVLNVELSEKQLESVTGGFAALEDDPCSGSHSKYKA